ncbi:MAG TPA: tRNA preQ1(34) S-adenosylmethionine ribosyltransferase-isomerase QueA [Desulfobacterales bacterium]|nr:tRNA preQ1(34) S-adenosylmethionine ribosyltransferase-isomerase QueA [Desulfobacterales bacterium]HIP38677.1 tRNA preQ1(34) S-adenosylmethionine ribosyltransferase-isomerase QueA [Desulfocapsa sulfexigens]
MQQEFSLKAYNYTLPPENIAQHPADAREKSKLLIMHRKTGTWHHSSFHRIIDLLNPGDLLVVNNTRVFPARLYGRKESGGKVEVFLLSYPVDKENTKEKKQAEVTALIKSSKRPKPGTHLLLGPDLDALVLELLDGGKVRIELSYSRDKELSAILEQHGQVPLPPYISRKNGTTEEDRKRYQTVYARTPGAVAAPTAGLHFSENLLQSIEQKGVETTQITLHVGHGTFAPVRCEDIRDHVIHQEYVSVSRESADKINHVRKNGGKIWAVGTTTVRTLEFMADETGKVRAGQDWCGLYILPGYQFKVVNNLITNFHLPESSLLFLVSALCGRETLMESYRDAISMGYRFYSYGDAMAICP